MQTDTDRHAPAIQFRPSDPLHHWINGYATTWNVTANEASKRLVALAAGGFGVDQHDKLLKLSKVLSAKGRPDFVRGCEQVKVALDAANRTRLELGKKALSREEREMFIQTMVEGNAKNAK